MLTRLRTLALCFLIAVFVAACQRGTEVSRELSQGTLIGLQRDGVDRFLGIRYALPPTGDRRWAAPAADRLTWAAPRSAKKFGPACVQGGKPNMAHDPQEDCLYLNVWAPTDGKDLPVMVWIHGGGNMMGASNEAPYDGEALAREQRVVVVSMNYRLSWLGFMAVPDDTQTNGLSANQGMLDQVEALRWVHDHIGAFGGNPDRVTVFGESAGGVNTCLLMASPLTDGLMHRAIMESGTCDVQHVLSPEQARTVSDRFFSSVDCAGSDNPVRCARALSIEQIRTHGYEAHNLLATDTTAFSFYPLAVIDGHFLPADPVQLLRAPSAKRIPLIIGTNLDEGSLFTGKVNFPKTKANYPAALDALFPGHGQTLSELYPWETHQPVGEAWSAMFSDAMMHCPANRIAELWSAHSPVYQYLFAQKPSAPIIWLMTVRNESRAADLGVYHGAELPYVLGNNSFAGHVRSQAQRKTRQLMMAYWVNFARSGNPNDPENVVWPQRAALPTAQYLELAAEPVAKKELRKAQCTFWDAHRELSFW